MLIKTLRDDLIDAMMKKEVNKKAILSIIIAEIVKEDKKTGTPITDAEQYVVLNREIKKLQDALTMFNSRPDMITEYTERIDVLKKYVPTQMTEDEIVEVIYNFLTASGVHTPSKSDKGMIMKNIMPQVRGKADGTLVNQIVDKICKV